MKRSFQIAVIAATLALPAAQQHPGAYPNYFNDFSTRYPDTALLTNYGCNTCHKDRANYGCRNPYGSDFSNSGINFETIEGLDSDGDGVTNLAEITAGTPPGRPDPEYIINRLLGKAPAALGDADVNCDVCDQSCGDEEVPFRVVDISDVVDALKTSDYFFPEFRSLTEEDWAL